MWGWWLALGMASPTQGVLIGGGASGDLLAEPAFATGGSIHVELGLTPGGERAAFRTGPTLNAGLSSGEQGRFGFGWNAGAIWGADDAVYQSLLFTGGGALFGTGDLGGFGRADLRWGFPVAGVAALEVGPFAAGWAGEDTPFVGQVGVQLTALAWLPFGSAKGWDLPDIDLPDIDLPDVDVPRLDVPALQPEPTTRQRDGGPLVDGPRDGGPLVDGPKRGGGLVDGPRKGGGPATGPQKGGGRVDGPGKRGSLVDAPARGDRPGGPKAGGPKPGAPGAGGPRAGGPKAGAPRAGGPAAGGPKAGGPKAGGPKAGAPGEGLRRDVPDVGKGKGPAVDPAKTKKKKKKKSTKKKKKSDAGAPERRRADPPG